MPFPFRQTRRSFVSAAAAAVGGAGLGLPAFDPGRMGDRDSVSEDELSALGRATGWLNSPALRASDLQGKVVLIDVCTYTCINWLRTLRYVREWDRIALASFHSQQSNARAQAGGDLT